MPLWPHIRGEKSAVGGESPDLSARLWKGSTSCSPWPTTPPPTPSSRRS
jgi:hypothetical protein